MRIIKTREALQQALTEFRGGFTKAVKVGFVPTMGALHNGHTSLVQKARSGCDAVVASIFVNPTQFNETADLQNYPRTLDADCEKLREAGCDIVFVPEVSEIYPETPVKLMNIDFGPVEELMEGKFRPGHFKGMATVVYRLFRMVEPDVAYFGEKDYQQFFIIRQMVSMLNMGLEVVCCPTLRESDGLAMSSRNTRSNMQKKNCCCKAGAEGQRYLQVFGKTNLRTGAACYYRSAYPA